MQTKLTSEKSKNRVISKHASLEELCLDASLKYDHPEHIMWMNYMYSKVDPEFFFLDWVELNSRKMLPLSERLNCS